MDTNVIVLPAVLSAVGSFLSAFLILAITRCWDYMVDGKKKRLEDNTRELRDWRNDVSEGVTFAGFEHQTARRDVGSWLVKFKLESIEAEGESIDTKLSEWKTKYGGARRYLFFWKRFTLNLQVVTQVRKMTELVDQEYFKDLAAESPPPLHLERKTREIKCHFCLHLLSSCQYLLDVIMSCSLYLLHVFKSRCRHYRRPRASAQELYSIENFAEVYEFDSASRRPVALPLRPPASHPPPAPYHELPFTSQVQGMDSIRDQILQYLNEHEVHMIGIWGIPGVGKTTLLKIINNYFAHNKPPLFDYVIFLVASKGIKLNQLQKKIMERLGAPSKTNDDIDTRATLLMDSLKYKKILLLLDDLWEHVDLIRLGIPLGQETCKVIFATRSEDVCSSMGADRSLKVECLDREEAWRLFKETVGEETIEADLSIHHLAEEVVEECGGLPLALVVIGRAMSTKKTVSEWQNALNLLRKSRPSGTWDTRALLPILEFSYQNLKDDRGGTTSSLDP